MPPPMAPPIAQPMAHPTNQYRADSQDQDDADGWDDDWDDNDSSYSGGDAQTSTMRERRDTASSIQRSGTVRKSMNRSVGFCSVIKVSHCRNTSFCLWVSK